MIAKLKPNGEVLLKKSSLVNRLYSKSGFGKLDKKGNLLLHPIEATYLLENRKIKLEGKDFQSFFQHCIKIYPRFEIRYLAFRDLRKRGYIVKILDNKPFDFKIKGKQLENQYIVVNSEREEFSIKKILDFLDETNNFFVAVVDEEGDITYYSFSEADLKGNIQKNIFNKAQGILLGDRVIVFEKNCAKELLEKEFFGKPFSEGIQLSFVEAAYLLEKKIVEIIDPRRKKKITVNELIDLAKKVQPDIKERLRVYMDLKEKNLIVKTGFKFGTHFRAYKNDPDMHHAEYLVEIVDNDFTNTWTFLSRIIRLAHSVKKNMVFAVVNDKYLRYISGSWLRM